MLSTFSVMTTSIAFEVNEETAIRQLFDGSDLLLLKKGNVGDQFDKMTTNTNIYIIIHILQFIIVLIIILILTIVKVQRTTV